jgi:hypothetical protein
MLVVASRQGNPEARIRDSLREREKPFREDSSAGPPQITPAWRSNLCFPPLDLALSSGSRARLPRGTPVYGLISPLATSHARSSFESRIVSV